MEITGIIIAKNEAAHIAAAIDSLQSVCKIVVVVDSGSDDGTESLAKNAGAKVVFHKWEGYLEQRRFSDMQAETDWVLVLDADERLSADLKKEILKLEKQGSPSDVHAYSLRRNLHFMGKCFRNNFFTGERKIRLYNRNFASWKGGSVHETVSLSGKIGKINKTIDHYPFENLEEAKDKLRVYAFLKALDKHNKGKKSGFWNIVLHILMTFLKKYIWQCYFMKGTPGLILSWLETDYSALKYMKLYELNHLKDLEDKKHEQ